MQAFEIPLEVFPSQSLVEEILPWPDDFSALNLRWNGWQHRKPASIQQVADRDILWFRTAYADFRQIQPLPIGRTVKITPQLSHLQIAGEAP